MLSSIIFYGFIGLLSVVLWKFLVEGGSSAAQTVRKGKNTVRIIGTGSELPGDPLPNEGVLEKCNLDCDSAWIESRIGIKTRHCSRMEPLVPNFGPKEGQANSDLCAAAATKALANAGVDKSELDLIIVSTCTPDYPVPSTATIVQGKMGIKECAAIDIRSACCGSMQALITAIQYLSTGMYKTAVVIGCDVGTIFGNLDKDDPTYTRQDRVNAVMIGDGAGALVLRGFDEDAGEQPHGVEILYYNMRSIGGENNKFGMYLPLGGSIYPATQERLKQGLQFFKHDYRLVLEHGAELYLRALDDILKCGNFTLADFDLFVPHQANGKIVELAGQYNFPQDRLFHNFENVGNTANASLLIAFDEIMTKNQVREGGLVAFGAAESTKWLYACLVVRWTALKGEKRTGTRASSPIWMRFVSSSLLRAVGGLMSLKKLFGRH